MNEQKKDIDLSIMFSNYYKTIEKHIAHDHLLVFN